MHDFEVWKDGVLGKSDQSVDESIASNQSVEEEVDDDLHYSGHSL